MEILKNGITRFASLSRISLIVIEDITYLPGREPEEDDIQRITIPDEWVIKLAPGNLKPCLPNEIGCYYLTEAGWEANKEEIKEVYIKAMKFHPYTTQDNTWSAYEKHVKEHFTTVNLHIKKKLPTSLMKKL